MAIEWAGWRLRLALKSYTLCWASMPSSADLQRQPQVPKTGIYIFLVYRPGNNAHTGNEMKHETGTCKERSIYKDDSVFFGRLRSIKIYLLCFQTWKKFFSTLSVLVWIFKTNIKNFQKQTKNMKKTESCGHSSGKNYSSALVHSFRRKSIEPCSFISSYVILWKGWVRDEADL